MAVFFIVLQNSPFFLSDLLILITKLLVYMLYLLIYQHFIIKSLLIFILFLFHKLYNYSPFGYYILYQRSSKYITNLTMGISFFALYILYIPKLPNFKFTIFSFKKRLFSLYIFVRYILKIQFFFLFTF